MTLNITPAVDSQGFSSLGDSALNAVLQKQGRFPPLKLIIKQITGAQLSFTFDKFLSYNFSSSILIPVDTFSFNFAIPDGDPIYDSIKDGDIATITANDIPLATGIIDSIEIENDASSGEKGSVHGRDLMSQLEDQDAVSLTSEPLTAANVSIQNGVAKLIQNTRIQGAQFRSVPGGNTWLLSTEPGESKLAALQRFLEPFNLLAWSSPQGQIIVGKPNMAQQPIGSLILSKAKRTSNVLSMKATRASTTIPNVLIPIYSVQMAQVGRDPTLPILLNKARRPFELRQSNHLVMKTVIIANPDGPKPQSLSEVNQLDLAGGGNLSQAYAKREMGRKNVNELIVQAVVPGHFNDQGSPYVVDTVYNIQYDRGGVSEAMYLYQCDYSMGEGDKDGQRTNLYFCKLGAIVADNLAP